ncbi:MAG: ABC transporter ATP-binding protein [Spirochaetaceae bacterium]|jgi:multiple sugar transport system ATP-binding protein|nr:ABC transporter ATP-binding protein [Spirochaetaceae bacterium]GMO29654.1 MAG: sn-glycerol-3-phosphate ABC transporter ATP-binding protein UgpC [Termitinemataceae bacterium]
MARIQLENITKKYKEKIAVDNLSLDIHDNEFFVLFGPAGAGKTTTLKVIAGIEFPQEGLVKIGGEIVNLIEPMYRNVSMVFENYALYPHLSVYDNIAFPLRSKRYKKDEDYIKNAVEKVIKMMNMHNVEGIYSRRPSQLSNGQRQRVAIGRCLVREPNVFLMDEPLAHLDAKLRHFMRGELKEMQSAFNTTTIYVTHDFMEAMSLADRIAVMNNGKIEQLGTSLQMYYTPINEFVARLFGEPEINIFPGELKNEGGKPALKTLGATLELEQDAAQAITSAGVTDLDIGLRGTDVSFSFSEQKAGALKGSVFTVEPIGNKVIMTVETDGTHIRIAAPNDTQANLDQTVYINFNMKNALYFNRSNQLFITRSGIENYR